MLRRLRSPKGGTTAELERLAASSLEHIFVIDAIQAKQPHHSLDTFGVVGSISLN
jgi:hypothetical protein